MILLHPPNLKLNTKNYINDVLNSNWLSSSGKYVQLFEKELKKITKAKYVISTNSGTAALHLCFILIGVDEHSEVVAPSVSYIASINPIKYCNSNIVFIDCDDNFNLDINKTLNFLQSETYSKNNFLYNKKTRRRIKAVLVVHVFGNPLNFYKLKRICKKFNILIVEDAAESLGSYILNKKKYIHTGNFGDFGCISFNVNKIITTGGGGAVLTNSKKKAKELRFLANQAKNDPTLFVHNKIGFNYSMQNMNAAIGYSQIKQLNNFIKKKKKINFFYEKLLKKVPQVEFLSFNSNDKKNYWLNLIKIKNKKNLVPQFIKFMFQKKIQVRPVWKLLYDQKQYKKSQKYDIQNSKKLIDNVICIPSGVELKKKDIENIINYIQEFINLKKK